MNTHNIVSSVYKKYTLNYPNSVAMGAFPRDAIMSSKQPW